MPLICFLIRTQVHGGNVCQFKGLIKGYFAPLSSVKGVGPACSLTACLQIDAWAGRNGTSYNGTLANTLDDNFRPRLICLDMWSA